MNLEKKVKQLLAEKRHEVFTEWVSEEAKETADEVLDGIEDWIEQHVDGFFERMLKKCPPWAVPVAVGASFVLGGVLGVFGT